MARIALGISYIGTRYQGWQSQRSGQTVQDVLEHALGQFAAQAIRTRCCGRTDAGVHALMQVVHFDCDVVRAPFSWVRGTNRYLPADIAVQWAQPVPDDFHARSSTLTRRYSYLVLQSPARPSIESGRVGWSFRPLDGTRMQMAAQHLIGEHDFTSFRASACQAPSPIRRIDSIQIDRKGAYWRFDFEANGFLHHMIRNLMGSLLDVGHGCHPPEWMADVLQARSRDSAAPTFSPDGLYFLGPKYAAYWGLPERASAYDWLP